VNGTSLVVANSVWDAQSANRRDILRAALVAGVAIASGGCSLLGLQWRYRYRLTAEIATPQGVRTGSSVIEVVRTKGYSEVGGKSSGEAVAIDLPDGQTFFLLLRGPLSDVDWPYVVPHLAFQAQLGSKNMTDGKILDRLANMQGARATLERQYYPEMVRFRDIRDPASVEAVDPDNLSVLGRGVRFRQITLEITKDPVTFSIAKRFSWWAQYLNFHFDGSSTVAEDMTSQTLSAHLSSGSFSSKR
jgi:hypothetical protein